MLSKEKVLKRIEEEIEQAYKKPMLATDHLWCLHYAIAVMKEEKMEDDDESNISN